MAEKKRKPEVEAAQRRGRGVDTKGLSFNIVKAAKENDVDGVKKALANDPACLNDYDEVSLMSALHWACANRNREIFDILAAEDGLELRRQNFRGLTPADLALQSGAQSIADDLHKMVYPSDHIGPVGEP